MLVAVVAVPVQVAVGEIAPIDHEGHLEYRYRAVQTGGLGTSTQHFTTWRAKASTFVWRPYILLLDGNLGLTQGYRKDSKAKDSSTIVTGSVVAKVFARSTFPFQVYFQSSDSRVDGELFDADYTTRNWGFTQQLASRRTNGRLTLEYHNSDTEEVSVNGTQERRKYGTELWQLTGGKVIGRNEFRLITSNRKSIRRAPDQFRDRTVMSLRHQFRGGLRFSIDDSLFYSDEKINLHGGGGDQSRRFLQFNGYSNWRPETAKPLILTGRLVAQGVEAINGTTRRSDNYLVSGSATYQYSPNLTFAASAGINGRDGDNMENSTGAFQRLRAAYRGRTIDLGWSAYNWGGSIDLFNRSTGAEGESAIQTAGFSFNHGLSRGAIIGGGRRVQFGLTQSINTLADSLDRRERSLAHTAYATLNRQRGRTTSYLRFSASDRRNYGDRGDNVFQLLSLQGSIRMRMNRTRSLNGGFTLQFSDASKPMMMDPEANIMQEIDTNSFTFGASLSYFDRELFHVPRLTFLSELRYYSAQYRDDDEFGREDQFDPQRSDSRWRNELTYTVGLLEFRLQAAMNEFEGNWTRYVFFSVRRYYGRS